MRNVLILGNGLGKARRHREALLGKPDGGIEQARPGQPPVLPMRRPPRERIAALANPATAELALFPAAVAGFAVTQLASIGGSLATLLHLLLH